MIGVALPKLLGIAPYPSARAGKAPLWMVSQIRWTLLLFGGPLIIWGFCASLPVLWVLEVGNAFDRYFWSLFKTTNLSTCKESCRDLVFGMIVYPISWILILFGVVRFWKMGREMEQQEKEWMNSEEWKKVANQDARSLGFLLFRTPIHNGLFVLFYSFWVLSGFAIVGEVGNRPGEVSFAYTDFKLAIAIGIFTWGFAAFGLQTRGYQTLAAWQRMLGKK